jgi:hypothetical protein
MSQSALGVEQIELPGIGHAYAPADAPASPAILLLHGSEGDLGWLGHRDAAFFAAHGFLAAPLGYSVGGNYWIGGDIWNAELDRTEAALIALRSDRRCSGKVGVYGWSRGAEHALLLTALMAQAGSDHLPDAVAAHAPPDRVHGAWRNLFYRYPDGDSPGPPRWGFQEERFEPNLPAWIWRGSPVEPGTPIAIEAYGGPVFLSVGENDEIWSPDMAPRLAERLRAAGRNPEFHSYAGQLHLPDTKTWNLHLAGLLGYFHRWLSD